MRHTVACMTGLFQSHHEFDRNQRSGMSVARNSSASSLADKKAVFRKHFLSSSFHYSFGIIHTIGLSSTTNSVTRFRLFRIKNIKNVKLILEFLIIQN